MVSQLLIVPMKMNQSLKPILATMGLLLVASAVSMAQGQQVNPAQNQIEQAPPTAPLSILCRPDHVLVQGKCVQLRKSLSDLVREILENSEGSNTFLHYQMADGGNPTIALPSSVPVSDLFIQNLAVISEANMSSCLALATCNEHCLAWPGRNAEQRLHEESVLEKFLLTPGLTAEPLPGKSKDDTAIEDDDATGPDFVRTIMLASRFGVDLAKKANNSSNRNATCSKCVTEYNECSPIQYSYTVRINSIYRQLVEANATLYDKTPESNRNLSPESLYYHYSMRFLDLANLTSCYAQVSCENSCQIYKSTISNDEVEMVGPPPNVSPFLMDDSNKPKAIDIIHNGALIGYKLALDSSNECEQCGSHYKDCSRDRYEIARASSSIFG